jgi:hypothetical protein
MEDIVKIVLISSMWAGLVLFIGYLFAAFLFFYGDFIWNTYQRRNPEIDVEDEERSFIRQFQRISADRPMLAMMHPFFLLVMWLASGVLVECYLVLSGDFLGIPLPVHLTIIAALLYMAFYAVKQYRLKG